MAVSAPGRREKRALRGDALVPSDGTPGRTHGAVPLALAAIVATATLLYAALALTVDAPRVFSDELLYLDVAASVEDGEGLAIRGESYRYAPLYPVLVAPILAVAPDREVAYELAKALNALLFALAAVPLFLLARRILEPWWSVVAAGLSVAVPSAMYVSVVMTESLAYLAFAWALYAIVRALEHPSVPAQLVALLAIAVAAATRTQFLALGGAHVLGLVLVTLVVPDRRRRLAGEAARLWPTGLALAAGAAVFLLAPRDGSAPDALGNYGTLWRSYDVFEVAKWFVYDLANLEIYLAIVPLAVAPVVLAAWYRSARRGDRRDAAFMALFVSVNSTMILLAAAFNTTIFAGSRLHDRPLFYVLPLWLILVCRWLQDGAPRPAIAVAIGAVLALVLPLVLPFDEYAFPDVPLHFNAAPTALWTEIDQVLAEIGLSGLVVLVGFTLVLVLGVLLVPPRATLAFPAVLLACFWLMAAVSWDGARTEASEFAAALPEGERQWIDEQVPAGRTAAIVTALQPCLPRATADAFYLSEFFNRDVGRVVHLGSAPDYLPSPRARVSSSGALLLEDGHAVRTDYVVTQDGVSLAGRPLARTDDSGLALWKVGGTVRVRGARSTAVLLASVCP
jgi:Dolichyl-phosphate-mannose-protein mannosyltransferase